MARHPPGKGNGMRLLLFLIALIVVVVIADALISREAEDRGAQALRDELTARTGEQPDRVQVELKGWLAGVRLLAGPAPDAIATVRGLELRETAGSLTRLHLSLDEVHADAGELLGGAPEDQLPFTARSGTFRAVLDEGDLNQVIGPSQLFERLEVAAGGISAIPPSTSAVSEPVPLTTELGRGAAGGDVLVLRQEQTGANAPLPAGSTLTIPFVLPDALDLQQIQTRSDRLIGTGEVDVEALAAGSGSS